MMKGVLRMGTFRGQFAFMFSAFARGPLFLWGIACAWVYHVYGDRLRAWLARPAWMRAGGADLLLAAVLVGLALFLRWVANLGPGRQMGAADQYWNILNGAFWAAILMFLLLAPLRSKRLVCNPLLARLGVLSYSIYLLHVPFMAFSIRACRSYFSGIHLWSPRTLLMVSVLSVILYGVATQTYRWIERPFLVRKSKFE
jgi:peptidoglycan/LPS O-acetylase OafA/YrhL